MRKDWPVKKHHSHGLKKSSVANPLHVEARISFTAAVITADCSQPDKADK